MQFLRHRHVGQALHDKPHDSAGRLSMIARTDDRLCGCPQGQPMAPGCLPPWRPPWRTDPLSS